MITQKYLESKLRYATAILHNTIAPSDCINYISSFLFLKRLSDVFEEEAENIEAETGDYELAWNEPDEHTFFVPKEARWGNLQLFTENIGAQLNEVVRTIEDHNRKLQGILSNIDFNDERKMGSRIQQDNILSNLILHFSDLNLRNSNLSEPDVLGQVYKFLLKMFAEKTGKKGGEFYTPHKIVELIVQLLNPQEGMRICDPTCGTGSMLIECAKNISSQGGNSRNISLYGQEINLATWNIAQINMFLHNIFDFDIRKGDVIRQPALLENDNLMLFDLVVAHPPLGLRNWGYEEVQYDSYHRFEYGIPPQSQSDFAFIEHIIATLKKTGRAGLLVSQGVLFRGGNEKKIRKALVHEDLIETVIGLPPNLLYSSRIPVTILIFNRHKHKDIKGKLLFIDASCEYQQGKPINQLRDKDIAHILNVYKKFINEDKYATVVSIEDVITNDYNLNFSRYVNTSEPEKLIDVEAEMRNVQELENKRSEAEKAMDYFLKKLGFKF